jgi:hypothetical protein
MSGANQETKPNRYIIQVKNHLDSHWEQWFEGMTITHIDDGVTILSGDVLDQSALYGLLQKLHNLNLSLILVQRVNLE